MATRGRPAKPEEDADIHKKIYYTPSPRMAQKALQKVKEDRLMAGYAKLHQLAFDKPLPPLQQQKLVDKLYRTGFLL